MSSTLLKRCSTCGVFMSRVPPSWRFLCGGSPRIKRRRIRKRQDSEKCVLGVSPSKAPFQERGNPCSRTFRNSKRRRKPKLEIHKLVRGQYELADSNPLWMPEIGLGIGYERGEYGGLTRDWLYWYNEDNRRYPTPAEQIRQAQAQVFQEQAQLAQAQSQVTQAQAQVAQERDRSNKLAARLRALGIDPDEI
jgi:hypothetical protein